MLYMRIMSCLELLQCYKVDGSQCPILGEAIARGYNSSLGGRLHCPEDSGEGASVGGRPPSSLGSCCLNSTWSPGVCFIIGSFFGSVTSAPSFAIGNALERKSKCVNDVELNFH